MILEEILEKVDGTNVGNTFLYFVTRILKPGVKKSSKMLDKHDFKVYQIDVDPEIREYLYSLTQEEIGKLISKNLELVNYEAVTDSIEQIFTYSMSNKAMSFKDVVENQFKRIPPKIISLKEILDGEELWAYCVALRHGENDWIYTFKKITASKVAIDEKYSNKKTWFKRPLRTFFNTKSKKLELIKGETINLDKQIDCIYYGDTFYIVKKTLFEQIIGLEEEYRQQAIATIDEFRKTGKIVGHEIILAQIERVPALHKKLVRIYKIGNFRTLNDSVIQKMKELCDLNGVVLKVVDGKLIIEKEKDIEIVLRMLGEFYKRGTIWGELFEGYGGRKSTILSSKT